jgi:hypothetical protein
VGDLYQIPNNLEHDITSEDLLPCWCLVLLGAAVPYCPAPVCRGLMASIRKRASSSLRRAPPTGLAVVDQQVAWNGREVEAGDGLAPALGGAGFATCTRSGGWCPREREEWM